MKKKLALLLALSMILSMLPMNVFGASRIYPDTRVTSLQGTGGVLNLEVSLDFADFYQHVATDGQMIPGARTVGNFNVSDGYPISFELRNGARFDFTLPLINALRAIRAEAVSRGGGSTINGFASTTTDEALKTWGEGLLGDMRVQTLTDLLEQVRDWGSPAVAYDQVRSEISYGLPGGPKPIDAVTPAMVIEAIDNMIPQLQNITGLIRNEVARAWGWDGVGIPPTPVTFITAGNDKTSTSQPSLTGDRYVVTLNDVRVREVWDSYYNGDRPVEVTLYFQSRNMDFGLGGARRVEFEMPTAGFMRSFTLPIFADTINAEIRMIDRYRSRHAEGSEVIIDWQSVGSSRNVVTAAVRAPVSFESFGILDQVTIAEPFEGFIDGRNGGGTPVSLLADAGNANNADFIQFRLSTASGTSNYDNHRSNDDEPDWATLNATGIWTGNNDNTGTIGTGATFYPTRTYALTSRFNTFNTDRIRINNQNNRPSPTRNRVVVYFDSGIANPTGTDHVRFVNGVGYAQSPSIRGDVLALTNVLGVSFDTRQSYTQDIYLQYNYNNETDSRGRIVWRNAGVAARRGQDPTGISVVGDRRSTTVTDLRKIRTGGQISTNTVNGNGTVAGSVANQNNRNQVSELPGYERDDRRTNVILIRESNVNTWNSHETTISMPDGVEIRGAHVAVYDRRPDGTRVRVGGTIKDVWDGTTNTRLDEFTRDDSNNRESWVAITNHANNTNNAGISITPTELRFNPNFNFVSANAKEVEIQFILSIEAGYAWKNSNGDTQTPVVVTLNDPILGTQELEIATAVDPISVDITNDAPVEVPVDAAFNVSRHSIGDIIISETEVGMLQDRTELWLYVVGNRNSDIVLDANRVPEVNNNTQFRIYNGRQLNHQFANIWLNGIRFNIERRSSVGRTGEEPAEIVIRDVEISGMLYSGVEYKVIVSGNAVAANDYTVMMDEPINTTNNSYRDIVGMFDTIPYYVTPFTLDESTYGPPPSTDAPAGSTGVPGTVVQPSGRTPLFLNVNSPRIPVTVNGQTNEYVPFAMIPVTRNVSAGGISAAVFAQFIGGTADWASPVATITGINAQGQSTTVTLTSGSNMATINGQSVDIAAGSNYSAEFANQVMPYLSPQGSMYLPLAFLCNAFGVQYEWNPSTATVTLR